MLGKIITAVALSMICLLGVKASAGEKIAWIAGHWCTDADGEVIEEFWLPPIGGEMLGLSRTRKKGQMTGFEYLRIVITDGVMSYIAQPGGRPPTLFTRSASGENWVRFENPDHDFPQRIEYRRDGDTLKAEIAGPGSQGQEMVIPFNYQRCRSSLSGAGSIVRR